MKKHFLSCILMGLMAFTATAQRKGFAIVIDPASLSQAKTEVEAYAAALSDVQGFHVYTVVDRWGIPDSIRAELQRLHALKQNPIVGAVFVGDIPVPMIRDAQFLTSAFKMNQKMPRRDSSVPSDRFYDDFGLHFQFIDRDTAEFSHLFYYTLTCKGNQTLHPDLFTGRIRPTDAGGTSRYEKLRAYLRKATAAKRNPEPFQSVFVYTGSGSVNESRVAHIDEQLSMREHFPQLAGKAGAFSYMDFTDAPFIKRKLMNEMMRPDLSLGFMHHHGDFDTQYLTHAPKPSGTEEALDYLLRAYRDRLRRAARYGQDVDSIRRMLTERDGLPESWLAGQPSPANNRLDSLLEDSLNLTLKDFATYGYRPNCRVAVYDACYNGAFHNADYIAGEYIFQPGRTIAGQGGTVNVIQDKWPDRYMGLLAEGVMIGLINQHEPELEVHIIGDPTFCFSSDTKVNLNDLIISGSTKEWERLLKKGKSPDVCCMALENLKDSPAMTDARLLKLVRSARSGLVRLQAFYLLQQRNSPLLVDAIEVAATDNSYELLQRMAVNAIPKCGHPRLTKTLAALLAQNNASARVAFNAMEAIQFMPATEMKQSINEALDSVSPHVTWAKEYRQSRQKQVDIYLERWDEDIIALCDGKLSLPRQRMMADRMKIYLPPYLVQRVAAYTEQCTDPEVQCLLLSSLGWHRLAYSSSAIAETAQRMSQNTSLPQEVRDEALKTYKRLKQ
ncbi:MAG: HEAT repeat domain-containing protein [Bacteroidaceae bacterium]|nr:HEAT repeat domain-containing protein [Bacteroidaceae bacterium]